MAEEESERYIMSINNDVYVRSIAYVGPLGIKAVEDTTLVKWLYQEWMHWITFKIRGGWKYSTLIFKFPQRGPRTRFWIELRLVSDQEDRQRLEKLLKDPWVRPSVVVVACSDETKLSSLQSFGDLAESQGIVLLYEIIPESPSYEDVSKFCAAAVIRGLLMEDLGLSEGATGT